MNKEYRKIINPIIIKKQLNNICRLKRKIKIGIVLELLKILGILSGSELSTEVRKNLIKSKK